MKLLLAAITLTICSFSAYSQTEWILVENSKKNDMRWEAKPGSLEFSKTKGGTPIVAVIGKTTNTKTSSIELYKWYVSADDCGRKMGKVVSLKISGEFSFENDFVFDSGTIASGLAEFICGVADYAISEQRKKGL